jgi:hypothetical protein
MYGVHEFTVSCGFKTLLRMQQILYVVVVVVVVMSRVDSRVLQFATVRDVVDLTRSSYDVPTVTWREKDRKKILRARRKDEPLLIRSIVENEESLRMWNPYSLAEDTKDVKWRTYVSPIRHMAKYINTERIGMKLAEFIHLESCKKEDEAYQYPRYPARYLSGFQSNEVQKKLKILSMGRDESFEPIVRVSREPIQYGAHYDETHNHLIQLFGRKRVVLVPYDYAGRLQIDPETRHTGTNLLEDSNLLDVPALQVILNAGDALFIPAWMIHFTEALELNVALNQFS